MSERREKIEKIRAERTQLLAAGHREKWEAKVAAVRAARLAAPAEGKNVPADPAAAPVSGGKQTLNVATNPRTFATVEVTVP